VLALQTSRYDAVVFDMDGVITDTARVHAAAWKTMFDEFLQSKAATAATDRHPFAEDDYLRYVDGRPRDEGVRLFLASRSIHLPDGSPSDGPEAMSVWGLANRKNRAFLRGVERDGVAAFSSSVTLVRDLQAHGVDTAVISASRNASRILDAAHLSSLFAVCVDGIELERLRLPGKPNPAAFIEAAHRLRTEPARTVVIEDAIAGVQAGRDGGFALVVGVDRNGTGDELRSHGADVVIHDLSEVTVVS
jgi:alpha,alpha-trehalase